MKNNQLQITIDTLTILAQKFWFIFSITFVFTSVAIAYVLVVEPLYESTAVVFPKTAQSFSKFGGLSSLVGMMGVSTGDDGIYSTYYYPNLVVSKTVLSKVTRKIVSFETNNGRFQGSIFDYIQKSEEITDSLKVHAFIKNNITTSNDFDSGIFRVSFKSPSPYFAKAIVNVIVRELDNFNSQHRSHSAAKTMSHIDKRILEAKNAFDEIQGEYLKYSSTHQTSNLSPKASAHLDYLSSKNDLAKDIYINLLRQKELSEIEMSKNYPVLTVIDSAYVNPEKTFPKKRVIVSWIFLLSFILSNVLVLILHFINENKDDLSDSSISNLRNALGSIFNVRK